MCTDRLSSIKMNFVFFLLKVTQSCWLIFKLIVFIYLDAKKTLNNDIRKTEDILLIGLAFMTFLLKISLASVRFVHCSSLMSHQLKMPFFMHCKYRQLCRVHAQNWWTVLENCHPAPHLLATHVSYLWKYWKKKNQNQKLNAF